MNDSEMEFNFLELIDSYGKGAIILFKQKGYSDSEINKFYEAYKDRRLTQEKLLEVYISAYGYQDCDPKWNM